LSAGAKRLHLRLADVVAKRRARNQVAGESARQYRVGHDMLVDRVLRLANELLEYLYPPSHNPLRVVSATSKNRQSLASRLDERMNDFGSAA
jgi:hypothetical protein